MKKTTLLLALLVNMAPPLAHADNDYNKTGFVLIGSPDGLTWTQQIPTDPYSVRGTSFNKIAMLSNNTLTTIAQTYDPNSGLDFGLNTSADKGITWNTNACPIYGGEYGPTIYTSNADATSCLGATSLQMEVSINGGQQQYVNFISGNVIPNCNDFNFFDAMTNGKSAAVIASCYGSNVFPDPVPYPQSGLLVTNDMNTWTWLPNFPSNFQSDWGTQSPSTFSSIEWSGKEWMVFAKDNNQVASVLTSADGNTWNVISLPSLQSVVSLAKNNNEYMVVGKTASGPVLMHSMDAGATWTNETLPLNWSVISRVNYNNGTWVVVGQLNFFLNKLFVPAIAVSHDGVTWQNAPLPNTVLKPATTPIVNDVIWDGTEWIAAGNYESTSDKKNPK